MAVAPVLLKRRISLLQVVAGGPTTVELAAPVGVGWWGGGDGFEAG